jgi:hypothetical protein
MGEALHAARPHATVISSSPYGSLSAQTIQLQFHTVINPELKQVDSRPGASRGRRYSPYAVRWRPRVGAKAEFCAMPMAPMAPYGTVGTELGGARATAIRAYCWHRVRCHVNDVSPGVCCESDNGRQRRIARESPPRWLRIRSGRSTPQEIPTEISPWLGATNAPHSVARRSLLSPNIPNSELGRGAPHMRTPDPHAANAQPAALIPSRPSRIPRWSVRALGHLALLNGQAKTQPTD